MNLCCAQAHTLSLSVGGKEEHSAPDDMRCVGENTRQLNRLLKQYRDVRHSTLEMNPVGHFVSSETGLPGALPELWTERGEPNLQKTASGA